MRRSRTRCQLDFRAGPGWSVAVVCVVTACGGPPAPSEAAQTTGSWGATAHFVTDRWEHAAVSRKFTVVTLAQAGKELETLATKVAQLPDSASGRASLVAGLKTIRADIAALDSAAVHGDRAAAARVATQLAVATAQMDTLHDELDAKQKRAERK